MQELSPVVIATAGDCLPRGQGRIMEPTPDSKCVTLPPLEQGKYRVVAGDNALYDVPFESIEQAKKNDPDLRVLFVGVVSDLFQR
jgi:hypothetical protein